MQRFSVLILLAASSAFAQPQTGPTDEYAMWVRPRSLPPDVTPRVNPASCGRWTGFYGPIDYRSAGKGVRSRVESHHFDAYLPRFLTWSVTSPFDRHIAANLAYTLRAFPNHPVAMLIMDQIGRRLRTENIPGGEVPLECWYVRALQTVPDDPAVRALYGIYLAWRDRKEEARSNLDLGDKGTCMQRGLQYQMGLARFKLGDYEVAQRHAMRAERLGLPLDALKRQLLAANHWDDKLVLPDGLLMDCPTAATEAAEAPAAAASVTEAK
jgi:hypothetical protein